jgi:hypothetical protein
MWWEAEGRGEQEGGGDRDKERRQTEEQREIPKFKPDKNTSTSFALITTKC